MRVGSGLVDFRWASERLRGVLGCAKRKGTTLRSRQFRAEGTRGVLVKVGQGYRPEILDPLPEAAASVAIRGGEQAVVAPSQHRVDVLRRVPESWRDCHV